MKLMGPTQRAFKIAERKPYKMVGKARSREAEKTTRR